MKKQGLLNASIGTVTLTMGHTDTLTIADAGLPIPAGPERIDLVVKPGLPSFLDVLDVLLDELVVEAVVIAEEMAAVNPALYMALQERLPETPMETVPHELFKEMTGASKAIVRTGEFAPYANIILKSGVAF
jgi:D-ribose pyranase